MTKNKIRERRYELGMTLAQVAKICGVPISTLSDIERGTEPLVTTAQRIAKALGVSVDDLWSI